LLNRGGAIGDRFQATSKMDKQLPILANASRERAKKDAVKLAQKTHIALRSPSFRVEVDPHDAAHINVTIDAERFELGAQLFNGAALDLTPKQMRLLIQELQHGLRLYEDANKL